MEPLREEAKETFVREIRGLSHHFYIIEGDRAHLTSGLFSFLEGTCGISTQGNPDFYFQEHELFGIEDARRTKEMQSRKNVSSGKQVFVHSFSFISHEAQNALLKMLEEPADDTFFFLVVPDASIFLGTVLSRAHTVKISSGERSSEIATEKFLASSGAARIKMLQKIINDKDKTRAISFLDALLGALSERRQAEKRSSLTYASILSEIEKSREYLFGRGSQVKMILEHVALTAPREGNGS